MVRRTSGGNYRLTLLVLTTTVAAFALSQGMVGPVLPTIQHDLHTDQRTVTWVLTGYLLSAAVLTPILGRVGEFLSPAGYTAGWTLLAGGAAPGGPARRAGRR